METLTGFIKAKYKASPRLKRYYGSFEKYREHYATTKNLSEWLEGLRDTSLTADFVHRGLGKVFLDDRGRTPEEMPGILAQLSNQYNVDLPVVEGILTVEYWQEKAPSLSKKFHTLH